MANATLYLKCQCGEIVNFATSLGTTVGLSDAGALDEWLDQHGTTCGAAWASEGGQPIPFDLVDEDDLWPPVPPD